MVEIEERNRCIYYLNFYSSGKGYVGQTKRFEERMKEHQKDSSGCRYLKNAIALYGFDDCSIHVLEDELTFDEANFFETHYIKELGTLVPNGYNLNEGGNCAPMLQETKDLLSDIAMKRWQNPEFREKQLQIMRTEEYREKHRINSTKMWEDPDFRANMSAMAKERWEDSEYRLHGSEVMKLKWKDLSYREKMSIGFSKYWENIDNVEAARARMKKLWEDPDFREKVIEGTRRACNTTEMKEIRSENAITLWSNDEFREKQMNTRNSKEFKEKMSMSLNSEENVLRRQLLRDEKSKKCREAFLRLEGDRRKVAEELEVSTCTITEWLKPYKDDEDIIEMKKKSFRASHSTPEMKEKKRLAAVISNTSRDAKYPMKEKIAKCRELFLLHEGDRQRVAEEMGVSIGTVGEYMKKLKDDDEIQAIAKSYRSKIAKEKV